MLFLERRGFVSGIYSIAGATSTEGVLYFDGAGDPEALLSFGFQQLSVEQLWFC
jgi:hypothetical protein